MLADPRNQLFLRKYNIAAPNGQYYARNNRFLPLPDPQNQLFLRKYNISPLPVRSAFRWAKIEKTIRGLNRIYIDLCWRNFSDSDPRSGRSPQELQNQLVLRKYNIFAPNCQFYVRNNRFLRYPSCQISVETLCVCC